MQLVEEIYSVEGQMEDAAGDQGEDGQKKKYNVWNKLSGIFDHSPSWCTILS